MLGVKSQIKRAAYASLLFACSFAFAANATAKCVEQDTLFSSCEGSVNAELLVLPQEPGTTSDAASRIVTVTGTYSSGDRFGIEGLALKNGQVISSRFQGWDGGLLITRDGTPSIANVARLNLLNESYNLKNKTERTAFVNAAKTEQASFIQSHLLITDGRLDTREVEGAPKFQRRILYSDKMGALSLYDSGTRRLTLFEAAKELHETHKAHMALNLDMGSYDFCEITTLDSVKICGVLASSEDSRLTNLLRFTIY